MANLTPEVFSARLGEVQRVLHLSPKEMARDLGVTMRTYRRYARGERLPLSVDTVLGFCQRHGVTTDYMLGKTDQMFLAQRPPACPLHGRICEGPGEKCPLGNLLRPRKQA